MAYRWRPKSAEVDPDNPRAWGTCDRCGRIFNLHRLQFQYSYQGSTTPQNTGFLVCDEGCLDVLNPQDMPYILPPDPMPVYNARPEPYTLDETSYLTTQDDDTITTQDDEPIITAIPNPGQVAATAHLQTIILAPSGSVAVAYLDIFNGNPLAGGVSVLADITGSATRTNVAAELTTTSGIAQNTDVIVVSLASESTVNTNYCGIYDAATGGTLLMSGALNVNGPTVTTDNPVQFDALALTINLN